MENGVRGTQKIFFWIVYGQPERVYRTDFRNSFFIRSKKNRQDRKLVQGQILDKFGQILTFWIKVSLLHSQKPREVPGIDRRVIYYKQFGLLSGFADVFIFSNPKTCPKFEILSLDKFLVTLFWLIHRDGSEQDISLK